jgi:F-box protein 21
MGLALFAEDHPSLPLISTAIFCCIAKRLGLDAQPCGFPFHVFAIVKPPKGLDMDGQQLRAGSESTPMYLDPFQSEHESPIEELIALLQRVGVPRARHDFFLESTPTLQIILRSGHNIIGSIQESYREIRSQAASSSTGSLLDEESAFYGALWALVFLGFNRPDGHAMIEMREIQNLNHIIEYFESHFPTDVALIEEYILPLYQDLEDHAALRDTVRVIMAGDSMPKQVKHRNQEAAQHVRYKVGQVFRHRRYDYLAVIIGWDVECGATEHWMARMRVHELARGRNQSFYHVL